MKSLRQLSHDWRVRTMVPMAIVHIVGFGVLYLATRHLAVRQMVGVHEFTANEILDEASEVFSTRVGPHGLFASTHGPLTIRTKLAQLARVHTNVPLKLFDSDGGLLWTSGEEPLPWQVTKVKEALADLPRENQWSTRTDGHYSLIGTKVLRNAEDCHTCHSKAGPVLGALVLNTDLTATVSATTRWSRNVVLILALSWMSLSLVMTLIRSFVIGRPLARIEDDINVARPGSPQPTRQSDLDDLARRLHETIWQLLENEKRRQADLTKQMARAEQMAALGAVAAGLSHEIKNPLAGIRTAVEVLGKEEDDPEGERAQIFRQIVSELDRVNRTVENLLRLARPQRASRMPSNLERIAENAITLFHPQLRKRDIKLNLVVEGTIPTLDLDSDLVMQILLNLLNNAAHAVHDGGSIEVVVSTFPQQDGALLSVVDDGAGISEENIERVFEPFFTTKATGTGLGLPLCRQMVEQHGGTMTIESRPGEGTRVIILFPAARDALTDAS